MQRNVMRLAFIAMLGFWIFIASAQTYPSKPILERIAEACARAARDPAYRELVTTMTMEAASSTPEQFQALVKEEIARYGEVVRQLLICGSNEGTLRL